MKSFIAIESSAGDVYFLAARSSESAYKKFGKQVLKMEGDIDTGNVDIDLYELPENTSGVVKLEQPK